MNKIKFFILSFLMMSIIGNSLVFSMRRPSERTSQEEQDQQARQRGRALERFFTVFRNVIPAERREQFDQDMRRFFAGATTILSTRHVLAGPLGNFFQMVQSFLGRDVVSRLTQGVGQQLVPIIMESLGEYIVSTIMEGEPARTSEPSTQTESESEEVPTEIQEQTQPTVADLAQQACLPCESGECGILAAYVICCLHPGVTSLSRDDLLNQESYQSFRKHAQRVLNQQVKDIDDNQIHQLLVSRALVQDADFHTVHGNVTLVRNGAHLFHPDGRDVMELERKRRSLQQDHTPQYFILNIGGHFVAGITEWHNDAVKTTIFDNDDIMIRNRAVRLWHNLFAQQPEESVSGSQQQSQQTESQEKCTICFEEIDMQSESHVETGCHHHYHRHCLTRFFNTPGNITFERPSGRAYRSDNCFCPVCRARLHRDTFQVNENPQRHYVDDPREILASLLQVDDAQQAQQGSNFQFPFGPNIMFRILRFL